MTTADSNAEAFALEYLAGGELIHARHLPDGQRTRAAMMSTVATRRLVALILCCSALIVSPALTERRPSDPRASCADGVVSRLYVGQAKPTGAVTEAEWRIFITESVTPRFPAGFTELRGHGHWRNDRGTAIEEDTRIIEIVHDATLRNQERVRAVAADYKSRFNQQSVLITQAQSSHCF